MRKSSFSRCRTRRSASPPRLGSAAGVRVRSSPGPRPGPMPWWARSPRRWSRSWSSCADWSAGEILSDDFAGAMSGSEQSRLRERWMDGGGCGSPNGISGAHGHVLPYV